MTYSSAAVAGVVVGVRADRLEWGEAGLLNCHSTGRRSTGWPI